jgi:hypothetical protein
MAYQRNWERNNRATLRAKINEIKLTFGCVDCGYKENAFALQFDHRPGVGKESDISRMLSVNRKWSRIEAEIAKCDVRCANCHAIITELRRGDRSSNP